MAQEAQTTTNSTPASAPSLDDIRSQIFSTAKPKSQKVMFFGAEIELKQPSLEAVMAARSAGTTGLAVAHMIINYAVVPGTDIKIFTEADIDSIAALPFGGDLGRVNQALKDLSEIDVLGEEGNSEETPAS